MILWLKKEAHAVCKQLGFAYCHAIEQKEELNEANNLDLSIQLGSEFVPCGGARGNSLQGLGWRAKVTKARFISKKKLIEYMQEKYPDSTIKRPTRAKHYLLYEFTEVAEIPHYDLTAVHKKAHMHKDSKYMAVSSTWEEILKSQEIHT